MLWLACLNDLLPKLSEMYKRVFFPDHKIDSDLKISNTFHNTFPKQALKCDKYRAFFFFFFFLENPFLIKRIRWMGVAYYISVALPKP